MTHHRASEKDFDSPSAAAVAAVPAAAGADELQWMRVCELLDNLQVVCVEWEQSLPVGVPLHNRVNTARAQAFAIKAFWQRAAAPVPPITERMPHYPIFNEQALLAEITRIWGAHGVHAEVLSDLIRKAAKKDSLGPADPAAAHPVEPSLEALYLRLRGSARSACDVVSAWQTQGKTTFTIEQAQALVAPLWKAAYEPLLLAAPAVPEAVVGQVREALEQAARIVETWSLPTLQTPSMWLIDKAAISREILALAPQRPQPEGKP